MRRWAVGLLVPLLLGCAPSAWVWSQPGARQQDFSRDDLRCRERAKEPSASYVAGIYREGYVFDYMIYRRCLEAAGWELTEGGEFDRPDASRWGGE